MKATAILSSEHRVIEVVLQCLERMAEQAEIDGRLDRESAEQMIDFIRTFADKCHHGKEETHLFQTLTDRGMPREHGPVGVMLHEHVQGRQFVAGMAMNIIAASEGNPGALAAFRGYAQQYVQLLRAHILKEDNILFPMADRFLSEADQQSVLRGFEDVESEQDHGQLHEKYVRLAKGLAMRYGIGWVGVQTDGCACGH